MPIPVVSDWRCVCDPPNRFRLGRRRAHLYSIFPQFAALPFCCFWVILNGCFARQVSLTRYLVDEYHLLVFPLLFASRSPFAP